MGVLERGKRDHDCVLAVATAGCNARSWTLPDVTGGGSGKLCINSAAISRLSCPRRADWHSASSCTSQSSL
ncbi:hypothetical protein KC315_g31 [Hortaea werneckii]|nr:hypothetical protein KC315_g31 [Hortaea werneckii]